MYTMEFELKRREIRRGSHQWMESGRRHRSLQGPSRTLNIG